MRPRTPLLLLLASLATGCFRGSLGYYAGSPVAASGLLLNEDRLRRALEAGAYETALSGITAKKDASYAPPDRLLKKLYQGLVAYYAGRYEESGAALQTAADIAEDRWTKSLSKGALSMVTSDLALPYSPGASERLLAHYYAMLGYVRRDDLRGAAVEARRLSELLQRYSEKVERSERPTRAALHYLAGTVFEAAGERGDADVSYRNAVALLGPAEIERGEEAGAMRLRAGFAPAGASSGDPAAGQVVVVLETGFVAHPVEQSLFVSLDAEEAKLFDGKEHDASRAEPIAVRVLEEIAGEADEGLYCDWPSCRSHRVRHHGRGRRDDGPELKIAWAAFVRPARRAAAAWIRADGVAAEPAVVADLSDAVVADYRRRRAQVLARTVARAAAKYVVTKQAEKKHGEVGEWVASLGANALERADTRSWHLLPGQIAVTRLTLPVGRHRLSAELAAEDAKGPSASRRVDLGEVEVRPGRVTFVTTRVWRADGRMETVVARP